MDVEASIRSMETEMKKLKEARKRDTKRLKDAALKDKSKALAELRRGHNACVQQLEREVKDLKVIIAQHTKDSVRQERKIKHLEKTHKKKDAEAENARSAFGWLLTNQEKALLERHIEIRKCTTQEGHFESESKVHRHEGSAPQQSPALDFRDMWVEGQHVG